MIIVIGILCVLILLSIFMFLSQDRITLNKKNVCLLIVLYIAIVSLVYHKYNMSTLFSNHVIIASILFIATITDIKYKEIPLNYMLGIVLPAIVLFVFQHGRSDIVNLLVTLGIGAVFLGLSHFTKNSFGYGDSIIIIMLSYFAGFQLAISIVLFSLAIVGIVGLMLITIKRVSRKTELPFIPFISLVYVVYMLM